MSCNGGKFRKVVSSDENEKDEEIKKVANATK